MTHEKMRHVSIVGGGYMGSGIAQVFASKGYECVVADASEHLADAAVHRLKNQAAQYHECRLLSDADCQAIDENVSAAASIEHAAIGADLILEAVPEDRSIKGDVLGRVSRHARPDAIIGTNTSAIQIAALSASVEYPQRFLGVHWMNPAPFVPCVEVIGSDVTEPTTLETVVALLKHVGKIPAVVSDSPGFVANRLQYALFKECTRLVEEGIADPEQVDTVVCNSFGFRLPFFGPFAIADIAGLDVYLRGFETMESACGDRMAVPECLKDHVAAGDLGFKAGGGFYDPGSSSVMDIASYRDRSYWHLSRLKEELGDHPLDDS